VKLPFGVIKPDMNITYRYSLHSFVTTLTRDQIAYLSGGYSMH